MLEGPFAIIGGVMATLTLATYVFIEIVKPAWRRNRLRHPCNAYFSIMPATEGRIDYAVQDDRGHHVSELVLPPRSEISVELVYIPKLPFMKQSLLLVARATLTESRTRSSALIDLQSRGKLIGYLSAIKVIP
jgi:hypothetical protein